MNANQHYRRALGLLGKQGEPQDGTTWPTADFVRAQWHLAMAQALEGAERTKLVATEWAQHTARAQRESVKILTGFTDEQIDDLGGFPPGKAS